MAAEQTANNVSDEKIVSRLSKMQKEILLCLAAFKAPDTAHIGDLPRTGEIIGSLGRPRTTSNYAAVSRALSRLEERGLVRSYRSYLAIRGRGLRYALAA